MFILLYTYILTRNHFLTIGTIGRREVILMITFIREKEKHQCENLLFELINSVFFSFKN